MNNVTEKHIITLKEIEEINSLTHRLSSLRRYLKTVDKDKSSKLDYAATINSEAKYTNGGFGAHYDIAYAIKITKDEVYVLLRARIRDCEDQLKAAGVELSTED